METNFAINQLFCGTDSSSGATNLVVVERSSLPGQDDHVMIVYGNSEINTTFNLNLTTFEKKINSIAFLQRNENLLLEAVRNFVRKTNFRELNEALEEEEISEDIFYKELEEHPNKYAVTLRNMNSPSDVLYIYNIMKNIGFDLRDFTTSEVAEMFSVKENQLLKNFESCKNQIL